VAYTVARMGSTRNAIRYGFALGKVRVLATRVFGKATYERLLDAPDFAEQKRILSDTIYGRYLDNAQTAEDVERALAEALEGYYRFLEDAELPEAIVRFVRERYDYSNLKAALKAQAMGVPVADLLVDGLGMLPASDFQGDLSELPDRLASLVAEVAEEPGADGATTALIDRDVDAALFARLSELGASSGSRFLSDFAALTIDVANVRTIVRAAREGRLASTVAPLLFSGGSLDRAALLALYGEPAAALAEGVRKLAGRSAPLGTIAAADLDTLERLDVALDDVVARFMRRARMVTAGPEPIVAYVFARESEIAALRLLLMGSLAGLPQSMLRSRLRELVL